MAFIIDLIQQPLTHVLLHAKKIVLLGSLSCTVLFFSACGGGSSNNSNTQTSTPRSPTSIQTSSAQSSSVISDNTAGLQTKPSNTTCLAPAVVNTGEAAVISWPAAFTTLPNIGSPSSMFQLPGNNNYWYLLRQTGTIVRFPNQADANSLTVALDITDRVNKGGNEAGLLGVAVHPQFASNRYVFLFYTGSDATAASGLETRVARYTVNSDGTFNPASELIFLRIPRPYNNHQGGQLAFDSKGFLYIASGDGGSGGDPQEYGQNLNTLLGKILRIDVNTTSAGRNYAIPSDNPFVGVTNAREEIWAWGLRNPWRFSFDSKTDELWAGDVGQNVWEEINLITKGGNYGWGDMEGDTCYSGRPNCSTANKIKPLYAINQNNGSCSVTGGYVYRGAIYPGAYGKYFFTDYCESTILSITRNTNSTLSIGNHGAVSANIVSFAQDNQGEIYALGQASGIGKQIYKMQATTGPQQKPGVMPTNLSQTGCVSSTNPQQPASGLIPFSVIAPLWSDGADKERYLAIPDNTQVSLAGNGDFNFPVGSVLVKHFKLANRFIETRLFAHGELGWQGFSYEWKDDQTDALLLADEKDKTIGNVNWHFPSPVQCMTCHTEAAGFSLGLETLQLNKDITYPPPGTTANQLSTLEYIELFSSPLSSNQKIEKLVALDDADATLQERARSYLHTNCSNCHQPNGTTPSNIDLRYSTTLANTHICDIAPSEGDLGIANARIVAPAEPARSILIARMQATDDTRMPPLSSTVVDSAAITVISNWISSLTNCI
ncbi:MAG: PQQ-dependent sugar dehydrogenase [Pseudomonadota bacterium]